MKQILFALAVGVAGSISLASLTPFDDANLTLYVAPSAPVHLYAPENPETRAELPAGTILAYDTEALVRELDVRHPTRVCGVRVVDVADEDLRESEQLFERQDLCVSMAGLKLMRPIRVNGDAVKQAFRDYTRSGDLRTFRLIAKVISELPPPPAAAPVPVEPGQPAPVVAPIIGDPLKDCELGCFRIASEYGYRIHPLRRIRVLHKGIDLAVPVGHVVVAAADGKVIRRTEINRKTKKLAGYGYYVVMLHPHLKMETVYGHLSKFVAETGASVGRGDSIALSGNTGGSTGPHLHFETHDGSTPVNPRRYIDYMLK